MPKYTATTIIGFDYTSNSIRGDYTAYLFYQAFIDTKTDAYQLVLFGFAKQGFSGSPILNLKGEVIGVLQSGQFEIDLSYLTDVKKHNYLNEEDLIKIKMGDAAKDRQMISFATNIKYLNDKYIKSFRE